MGVGSDPKLLGSIPLRCVFFLLPEPEHLPQRGGVLMLVGPMCALSSYGLQMKFWDVSGALPLQAPAISSLALLRVSGVSLLSPSQPITSISLRCPHFIVEPHHIVGAAHIYSQHVLGGELWWSSCCQESGLLLVCCLSKCQQWLSPPHPGSTLGSGHLYIPESSLLPSHGQPRYTATFWQGLSEPGVFAHIGLGDALRWS